MDLVFDAKVVYGVALLQILEAGIWAMAYKINLLLLQADWNLTWYKLM